MRYAAYDSRIEQNVEMGKIKIDLLVKNGEVYITQNKYCIQVQLNKPLKGDFLVAQVVNGELKLDSSNKSHNNHSNNKVVVNNKTYVKFGNLSYGLTLTDKEQRDILRKQYMSLEESIKKIHFNKDLPEYSNVFITNIRLVRKKFLLFSN